MDPFSLLISWLRQSAPLVTAGLGGVLSERAGVVNIALEGMMLSAGFAGIATGRLYGPAAGLSAALLCGASIALLHFVLTQRLGMDHIVSGMAINLLALNGTTFLLREIFHRAENPTEAKIPRTLPMAGFLLAAILLPLLLHALLYRTRFGLRLRAVGEDPAAARLAGFEPGPIRLLAVLASGALTGLAGAALALGQVGRFTDDMVSGRGFVALAAVICGRWTPLGCAAAAAAFGLLDAIQLHLQGGVAIPSEFLRMLPYAITIVAALALRSRAPAALGRTETT